MTDRGNGLSRRYELTNKIHSFRIDAEAVGTDNAARQHQRVIILRICVTEGLVDFHFIAPLSELPPPDLSALGGDHDGARSCIIQRFARLDQFYLLESVGC